MDRKNPVAENQHSRRTHRERISRIANAARNEIAETPEDDETQIDLDGRRATREFNRRVRILQRFYRTSKWRMRVRPSRSGKPGHFHITVRAPGEFGIGFDNFKRVLLASLLGSDPAREIINFVRVREARPYPICFFRKTNVMRKREKWARFGPIPRV